MREWRDVHAQLKELAAELGWKAGDISPDSDQYAQMHRALLTGLLGNVGLRADDGSYHGARGIKFWVHPGSALVKKAPRWIMAAELTETTRLFARSVAGIEPEWLERMGAHLLKRSHTDPHWERKPAQVVAMERGTLYGLPVYANRRIHYGPLDPKESRGGLHPRRRSSKGIGSRARRSSSTTSGWCARSRSSSTSRGGRTCWSTTS